MGTSKAAAARLHDALRLPAGWQARRGRRLGQRQ